MKTTKKYLAALAILTAGSVFYGSNPASAKDIELDKVEAAIKPIHESHGRLVPPPSPEHKPGRDVPPPPPNGHRPTEFREPHRESGHVPPPPPEFRRDFRPGPNVPPPPDRPHRHHRPPHRW